MYQLAFYVVVFLGIVVVPADSQGVDQTLVPRTLGADVTEAVVRKIQRSGVFPHDQNLLRRLAFVETRDGEDSKTYRPNYFGGIWQLDEVLFNQTRNETRLNAIYQQINSTWNIQWNNVTWDDLLKPFYSGLGARIFLHKLAIINNIQIPGTINAQAVYWRTNYNRANQTVEYFQDAVRRLESDGVCEGLLDICIVLDGSRSIGNAGFLQAKAFVADFVQTFSLSSTRVAFSLYSEIAEKIFDFSNTYNATDMDRVIRNIRYPDQNTNTPAGLNMAVSFFNQATPRPGVPKVVATFTDGEHNLGNLPAAVNAVRRANLTSFAIGIGSESQINDNELRQIALNDASKVFRVTDYSALVEFFYQMNKFTCEVPQEPELGEEQNGTLSRNETRYFKYQMPTVGMTLRLTGQVSGWYSYTELTPNSALHDGELSSIQFIPFRSQANITVAHIAIRGNSDAGTRYTLTTEEGNQVPTTTIASTVPTTVVTSTTPTTTEEPESTTPNIAIKQSFINPLLILVTIYVGFFKH